MTAKKIDRVLLGLGALLIVISFYQLFLRQQMSSQGLKLGTLTSTFSVVKTKNALSLDWKDASSGIDVNENQLIYTDTSSSAAVVFDQGGSLEIGENSLIKISGERDMFLAKGFIKARLESHRPMKLQMNGEDYVLSGNNADIQINLQNEKGELGVLSGEVKVEGKGVQETLTPTTALAIEKDKLTRKSIHFLTVEPEKNSSRYFGSNEYLQKFSWTPKESGKILISKNPSLENAQVLTGEGEVTTALSEGLYYFKVEGDQGESLVSVFRLNKETAPEILRPRSGEKLYLLESNVLLQWKTNGHEAYLLEWNDGELHSQLVEGGAATIPVASSEKLRWRVKIQNDKRPEALFSDWQEVSLEQVPPPVMPTDLSPSDVDFQFFEKNSFEVPFSWEGGRSEIQIKTPSGNIVTSEGESGRFTFTPTEAGTHQWRIRGIDSYLRSSEWSHWMNFTVEDLSAVKAEDIQRIQLKKPDQAVTFSWKTDSGATSVFELSKDKNFSEVVKKVESKSDSLTVNIPETGLYYWRSREYKADGSFEVSEPKKVIIEKSPAPEKPEKLPDMEVPLEEMPAQTTLLRMISDWLLPSAYADEVKGIVKLDLPVKEESKGYVIRIYRDSGLTQLILEEQLATKHFEWINVVPGEYYWQYAIIDYWDRKSLFSDPAKLVIREDASPLAEKPKLLSPIRATAVEQKDLILTWTPAEHALHYRVEVATDENFQNIVNSRDTTKPQEDLTALKLNPGLHYWRISAVNKKNKMTVSNTGRFKVLPPLERIVIVDEPKVFEKEWKSRFFLGWAPSLDSYTFEDSQKGEISGTTLMSPFLSGTVFREKFISNGEILRQTGQVFEGESYLFQRLAVDGTYIFHTIPNHKVSAGFLIGQTSGQTYSISNSVVSSSNISGFSFGPVLRNYLSFNQQWEMQGRAMYLLGEIKQIEIGADAIRKIMDYSALAGLHISSRDYNKNSGKQSSIRFSLGIGKEF